jgi:hypothetical protein
MLALVGDVMVVRCVDADRRRSLVGRRFKTFFFVADDRAD